MMKTDFAPNRRFPGKELFVFLLSLYLLSMGKGYYSTDGEVMFKMTWAIVEQRRLGFPCEERLPNAPPGRDGLCYSKYGPGQSLALIPFYIFGRSLKWIFPRGNLALMGKWFADRANSFFTAFTVLIVGTWSSDLFGNANIALALSIIYGLSTLAWPYAKFNFNQPLTSLLLLMGFYFLWNYRKTANARYILLSGLSFGYLLFTRISAIVAIPWAFLIWRDVLQKYRFKLGYLVLWFSLISLFLLLNIGYNFYAFGRFFGGYAGEKWNTPFLIGLYGLLMSSGKGLLLFVPISNLFPWGLAKFFEQGKKLEAIICLGLLLTFLAFHAPFWTWHGGWSWGPRFLVPIMPFLVIPLGALWKYKSGKGFLLLFAFFGFLIQMLGTAVNFSDFMLQVNDETKILFIPEYSPLKGHFLMLTHQLELIDIAPVDLEAFGINNKWCEIGLSALYFLLLGWSSLKIFSFLRKGR
ncbi:MAG: hypothetical protein QXH20_02990 [Candidatus Bathyarchaeia archaeon]